MYQRTTQTLTDGRTTSTGVRADDSGLATEEPKYGWRELRQLAGEDDPECHITWTLSTNYGVEVTRNGSRNESYDLTIGDYGYSKYTGIENPFLAQVGLSPGRYEVKSLWRKSEGRKFDRRIKVGRRGERIYGRRDAAVKSFALELDAFLEEFIDGERDIEIEGPRVNGTVGRLSVVALEIFEFVDQALERRHSKSFDERMRRLAQAAFVVPSLRVPAQRALTVEICGSDILNGFEDLQGIFVVAGDHYTLVSQREISTFFAFDSASSEGLRLRFLGKIPSEPIKSSSKIKAHKVRKEQGNK